MRSIKEIYVIGNGPSSSHTMGPSFACDYILNKYKNIQRIHVTLYGSLALTGKGHLTDKAIGDKFQGIEHTITFNKVWHTKHPNTMVFLVYQKGFAVPKKEVIISVGGGTILTKDNKHSKPVNETYEHRYMDDIVKYCKEHQISLSQYVFEREDPSLHDYLAEVLKAMENAIERGKKTEGVLPGPLGVTRKAKAMLDTMNHDIRDLNDTSMNVAVAAIAVAEENASGGIVSTAPTCGSAGVIPGIVRYLRIKNVNDEKIIEALAVAGLFGMVCKTNASVSGAECGCQAEIGVASSMGAAMIMAAFDKSIDKTVQAAEIALEHSLGLTCDPVCGLVQIPCIERCAVYAIKAINAFKLALAIPSNSNLVSYDLSVKTMYETGKDINVKYRETGVGGLAKVIKPKKKAKMTC